MRIEIYPRAKDDIIRQFRYYLVDQAAPSMAFSFRESVIESVGQLKVHPRMGSMISGSIPGLRSWHVKGFEQIRIYYVAAAGCLRMVRILHSKRDVRRILRQEKRAGEP